MCICLFLQCFCFLPGKTQNEVAELYGSSIFNFLRNLLWKTVDTPIYISTNSAQGSPFLHILTNTCYLLVFDDSHSDRCEVVSHYAFGLDSLIMNDIKHLFICLLVILCLL